MPRIREHLIEETTRHGKTRYLFHRRPDGRRMTIKGHPGEKEFEARYEHLANGGDEMEELLHARIERKRNHEAPQTVDELVTYHMSYLDRLVEREELSAYTVEHYTRFTRRFATEFGSVPLETIEAPHIEQVLDHWSGTRNAYNNALRALKHLFRYARTQWKLPSDPTMTITKKSVHTDGFPAWEAHHLKAYLGRHQLGTKAHLAMMLLIHAAPRLSDLVALGCSNIVEVQGQKYLVFQPQKTKKITVSVPLHPDLEEAIASCGSETTTFLATSKGRQRSAKAFGNQIAKWRKEAGIDASVSAHGMRKTVGINMAENGATEYELMAALGHTTPKVTEVYTRAARRRLLASQAASKSTLSSMVKAEVSKA